MTSRQLKAAAIIGASVLASSAAWGGVVDLTAACGATGDITGSVGGTATFANPCQVTTVGTGVVDPFLSIGAANQAVVQGFNTDAVFTMDQKRATNFTGPLQVGDIGTTLAGFRQFYLDINESNGGNPPNDYLSLDMLQISFGATGDLAIQPLPIAWDMGPNSSVLMNYDLFKGSGNGFDLTFFIPDAVFAGHAATEFVYLYAKFGATGEVGDRNYGNSDGFEEFWARRATPIVDCVPGDPRPECSPPPNEIPEPGTVALVGLALLGAASARRRTLR